MQSLKANTCTESEIQFHAQLAQANNYVSH